MTKLSDKQISNIKSVNKKLWNSLHYDENFVKELTDRFGISDFLARMLSNRSRSIEEAEIFLDPKIKFTLPDPYHLKDMDKAVARFVSAMKNSEKICIFADYDVDGATSSAILKNIFTQLNINSDIYVPDRMKEGYGPTSYAMEKIHKSGASLIITVDCGSVAFEALEEANNLGMDVIVIDHHISLETLPKAVAVINPNRLDETSSCKNLAAVGVSFLFLVALITKLKKNDYFNQKKLPIPNLIDQLDLVALGTVCDVMQLTHLNRSFVAQGLKIARNRKNIGLTALCDISSITEPLNCYHLGFILGPRINAGGRVGKSYLGASLLSTKSNIESEKIAKELDEYNQERKVIEMQMLEEALQIASSQEDDSIIFVYKEGWHPGVIGIVAGRLKEKYNKPVAVIAINDGVGKSSCRSVKGVDFGCKVIEAKQNGLLEAGGGHAMAAGFTVMEEKLNDLKIFLNEEIAQDLKNSNLHFQEFYDAELTTSSATIDLVKEISLLEPFGTGNHAPIFKFSGLYVLKADIVGVKHIKVIFAPTKTSYSYKPLHAIAFNSVGTSIGDVLLSKKSYNLSVFGKLQNNQWQGRDNIQLQLMDLEKDE